MPEKKIDKMDPFEAHLGNMNQACCVKDCRPVHLFPCCVCCSVKLLLVTLSFSDVKHLRSISFESEV